MVASHEVVEQIVDTVLKHINVCVARKMVRDMYHNVKGDQSLMHTLCRVAQRLEEVHHGKDQSSNERDGYTS